MRCIRLGAGILHFIFAYVFRGDFFEEGFEQEEFEPNRLFGSPSMRLTDCENESLRDSVLGTFFELPTLSAPFLVFLRRFRMRRAKIFIEKLAK